MSLSLRDTFNKCMGLVVCGAFAAGMGYLTHKGMVQGDFDIASVTGLIAAGSATMGIYNTYDNFTGQGDAEFVRHMADESVLSI